MTQQFARSGMLTKTNSARKEPAAREASRRGPAVQPAALQRALADPASAAPETILHLQRVIGNRAVGDLMAGAHSQPLQAKLTVGPAGDRYEQEADRVADQVMNMPVPMTGGASTPAQRQELEDEELQAKPLAGAITPLVQRSLAQRTPVQRTPVQREAVEDEELQKAPLAQRDEDEEELQEKPVAGAMTVGGAGGEAGAELESSIQNAKSGGQALESGFRGRMENAFGVDFGGVRVHTDGEADRLNRSLQSRAFTTGRDLFFREGEYNPDTAGGQRLIAHELTHVIQQNGATLKPSVRS